MGTRADFYVGRGESAEWLGSTAWDGYPEGIELTKPERKRIIPGVEVRDVAEWVAGSHLFDATTEQEYRDRVGQFFANRDDVTLPAHGWPWPWEDSRTTDYAYAYDGGKVFASCFGRNWFDPHESQPDQSDAPKSAVFPNMKERANVTLGPRSGLIVMQAAE